MKKKYGKAVMGAVVSIILITLILNGCNRKTEEGSTGENVALDNVVITETGEVIEKEEPAPTASAMPENVSTEIEISKKLVEEPIQEQEAQDGRMQIVFLGDSIFADNGDGTDVPSRVAAQCNAKGYNLAIGGTTAAVVDKHTSLEWDKWTSVSLAGLVHAIVGNISTDVFEGYNVKDILDNPNVDFSKTDYFVIEYGVNDFLNAVPMTNDTSALDLYSYVGALRYAIIQLRECAPDATIILCSPTYARFFDGDWMVGDGNSINNGYGTLYEYKDTCEYVANEYQVVFYNAYEYLGIDGYTADEYLEDGIHLTDKGRQRYADALTKLILETEETKNN